MAVRAVVVAEAGRLGIPSVIVVADSTGGLPVRLQDGVTAPSRGTEIVATGVIADPYGQTELRLRTGGLTIIGSASLPPATPVSPGAASEATEGRLVGVRGMISAGAVKSTGGDITFAITGTDGATLRVLADASSGLGASGLRKGSTVSLTGIVGQRASHKGAHDGYRLWLRDASDVLATTPSSPSPSPGASAGATPSSSAVPLLPIAAARLREGHAVTVEGTVTIATDLLDASGRRAVIEDATGAVELYLDAPDPAVRPGARVRATGTMGRAWGAPRLHVDALRVLGRHVPTVHDLRVAPGPATEWRLVVVRGTVTAVHRSGDRWTADLASGAAGTLLVSGLAGSGIMAAAIVEGRTATVTGIVRRPYPTATDHRYAIVPRTPADIDLGPAGPGSTSGVATGLGTSTAPDGTNEPAAGDPGPSAIPGADAADAADVNLEALAASVGMKVRVGGLVTAVDADGIRLDDGTATARIVLTGDAADLAALIQPGDVLNAIGTPETQGDEVVLPIADPAAIILVGDLGEAGTGPSASAGTWALRAIVDPGGASGGSLLDPALQRGPSPLALALGTLGLTAALGVAIAARRRLAARRATRRRILERLATIGTGHQTGREPVS